MPEPQIPFPDSGSDSSVIEPLTSPSVQETEVSNGKNGSVAKGKAATGSLAARNGADLLRDGLKHCDLYMGSWVKDEKHHPVYRVGSCPYVDEAYDCGNNGRADSEYTKWRWKPYGCDLPRYVYLLLMNPLASLSHSIGFACIYMNNKRFREDDSSRGSLRFSIFRIILHVESSRIKRLSHEND